ncbi:flippase-like domain-containing protein [bacterium]|nr:flippase-like domain-containing protein [bacterium]
MKRLLKRLQPLIGFAISVVLVYLVLFSPQLGKFFTGDLNLLDALFGDPRIGLADLQTAWSSLNPIPALFGVLLLMGTLFLRTWRWRLIINQIGPAPYWTVFHGVNVGYLLNNVLPLRAGELLRAVIVAQRSGVSRAAVLSTVVAERVFDMAGLGIVFGVVTFLFPFPDWLQTVGLSFAGAVLLVLVVSLMLAKSVDRLTRWHQAIGKRGKVVRKIGETVLSLVEGLSVLKSPMAMVHVLWSTLALWACYITTMKLVLDAFQLTNGTYPALAGQAWMPAAAMTVITSLGFAIPSAPGGVGTYHAAVLLGLSWFDVPEGMGVIFATVMHAMNYLTLTLWGVISLFAMKLKFSDIVRTARSSSDSE